MIPRSQFPAQFPIVTTKCLLIILFMGCAAHAESGKPPSAAQSLPDSEPELVQRRSQVERQLTDDQAKVGGWKLEVANLTSQKNSVDSTPAPDPAVFGNLTTALKNNQMAEAKSDLQRLLSAAQSLYFRNQPVLNSSQAIDPDVSIFMSDVQTKISNLQNEAGLSEFFPVAYSQDVKAQNLAPLMEDLKQKTSLESFNKQKSAVSSALDGFLQQAISKRDGLIQQATDLQAEDDAIVAKQSVKKTEINELAIKLGLPLFCITVLLMLVVPIIFPAFATSAASAEQARAIFSSGILVEIITVLLLTMSILILGLSGKLEGPVLGTLLGGISGYVLNRFRGKNLGNEQQNR